MPKYIVSGGTFTPFSYEELVKPVVNATQAHAATQEALDQLAVQAGALGAQIGNGEDNARARALYDAYMQQVREAADALYKNGYNVQSSQALSRARRTFGTDISMISQALSNRAARAEEYRKASLSDPTLLAEYNPANRGLDNWLDNPQYGDFRHTSGTVLTNQGKQIAQNLRRQLTDDGEWRSILGDQYYQKIIRTGFTADEINEAVSGLLDNTKSSNKAISLLQDAMTQVYESSGMGDWADEDTKKQAIRYIGQGMFDAIGDVKEDRLQNHDHLTPMDIFNMQLNTLKAQAAAAKVGGSGSGSGTSGATGAFVPANDYRQVYSENSKEISKDLKKYFGSSYSDGKAVPIKLANGKMARAYTQGEASDLMYNTQTRKDAKKKIGIDIALDPLDFFGTTDGRLYGTAEDGRKVRTAGNALLSGPSKYYGIEIEEFKDGEWVPSPSLTADYRDAVKTYKKEVKEVEKLNPNIGTSVLKPQDKWKLIQKYNLGEDLSVDELPGALSALTYEGEEESIYLADPGATGEKPRAEYAASLRDRIAGMDNKIPKGAKVAFYPIQEGKREHDEKSVKKISDVFPIQKDGTPKIDASTVLSVKFNADSIGELGVVITTPKGKFFMPASMAGSNISDFAMQNQSVVNDFLLPVNHPQEFLAMSDSEILSWGARNGIKPGTTAEEIRAFAADPAAQNRLRRSANRYLSDKVEGVTQREIRQPVYPAASLTSSKNPTFEDYAD